MPSIQMTADRVLEVRDLSVTFRLPKAEIRAVDSVNFDLAKGEVLGIVGESGSGKSQILFAILGLLAANGLSTGGVSFGGSNLLALNGAGLDKVRGSGISIIFQDPMTALNPYMRIGDQLAEGLIVHRGASRALAWREAVNMLDRVRIPDPELRARAYPHEFSGGMRQRVMIAMALLMKPAILLADEPTTALDVTIQAQVLDLIAELAEETGTAVILVTHDLGVVARACDRVLVLYGGRVMEEASVDTLFGEPRHPYTRGLLATTPRLEGLETPRLRTIPGAPSSNRILGCPFAPRCERRIELCEQVAPSLLARTDRRIACHLEEVDGSH